ncbi:nucleotidyltransferase family protein [Blastomonas sp.]|uniref:nucleotidyltransferase domain-containing protein n=1 Tax=Blastomonas sp. TaxID=1909299 RepID=UPI002613F441|nr:nucleotidyltransferase family protein [Blastomonas sp.]MDM7956446.1 nucleotidyltransferase family protein [Blastomonas sp.]
MTNGWSVARALTDPGSVAALDATGWTHLLSAARALSLIGTLAEVLADAPIPPDVARVFADVRHSNVAGQRQALWEAECARMALAEYPGRVVLLKGTAFAAAGYDAALGRSIGDLDILVDRGGLDQVEGLLLEAGWEWVKPDPYDDAYYREWMHELPPLIHAERDRMIDVHHTILPLTAGPTPDAAALIADARALPSGLYALSPADIICHAAAHLIADGDLSGGMRNLWDIDRLVRQFVVEEEGFSETLAERAKLHGLTDAVGRALRLSAQLFGTPIVFRRKSESRANAAQSDPGLGLSPENSRVSTSDTLFLRRITAVDGWGRKTRKLTRQGFYIRSHLLRMPPAMLARHLWTKWRKGHRG